MQAPKQGVLNQASVFDYTKINFWTIKIDGSDPIKLTESNLSACRSSLLWSPTGNQLVYVEDGRVFVINGDGTGKRIIADLSGKGIITTYPNLPRAIWLPDGRRIAVYGLTRIPEGAGDEGSPELLIFNLEGELLNTYSKGILPQWWVEPDDTIYYTEATNGIGLYALWQSKIDGSNRKLISGTASLSLANNRSMDKEAIYGASSFAFSKDGKMIATVRDEWYSMGKTTSPLWIMNINSGETYPVNLPGQISSQLKSIQNLSSNSRDITSIRTVKWLPDNQHLVLQIYTTGFGSAVGLGTDRSELYSIKVDGTELRVLDSSSPTINKAPYVIKDHEISTGVELLPY